MIARGCVAAIALLSFVYTGGAQAAPIAPPVLASNAVIRPAPAGFPSTAAYVTLKSLRDRPERLLSVHCDCAADVMPHQSTSDGGIMRMRPATVVVPPKGEVALKPGGLHLMVMGLKHPIHLGDVVTMTLRFDHAAPVRVRFTAKA